MKPMNDATHDPLREFFASEWKAAISESYPMSPDFSTSVLKKIEVNRRKERLFNAGCISIALVGIVAVVVFIYPGYQQLDDARSGVTSFFTEIIRSLGDIFRLPSSSNLISVPLITYFSLLIAALLGLDGMIRKHREAHTTN